MKQPGTQTAISKQQSFSIHYWIVFLETTLSSIPRAPAGIPFSIHYWIVFLETWEALPPQPSSLHPFSIHYWIVFLETLERLKLIYAALDFQYPLLDRIS